MNIAVDARELAGRPTGVGRYLSELLTEWAQNDAALAHQWMFYAPEPVTLPVPFRNQLRVIPGASGTRWEQISFPRALLADRPAVLFAPGYTAPLRLDCPVVQTIHDVSYFAHPEWFTLREGVRRRILTRLSARRARVVITDSQFSRDEIRRHLELATAQIRVIPLGVRARTAARAGSASQRAPIVLFVGSIFRRRNVDVLIRAFADHVLTRVPDAHLEIVGEPRGYPPVDLRQSFSRDLHGRVTMRSYVDDETLDSLYRTASIFAFPSAYEGFGFTPLEALSAGVPPVVLDTAVAVEIYGAAARYVPNVPPLDTRLGEALVQLLTSATARSELLDHAPDVLARYRWDRTAAETLRAIEEAGRG